MRRILISNEGPDKAKLPLAFAAALKLAKDIDAHEVTLVAPSKEHFDATVVGEFLGDSAAKKLVGGHSITFKDSITLKLESISTLKKGSDARVILAAYIPQKDLTTIDSVRTATAVVFLPWLRNEGEFWQKTWNAEVLGESVESHEPQLHGDVLNGLNQLTARVNLSTGLGHPLDKQAATELFRDLQAKKTRFDPAEVRIWAVRNGWKPVHAEDLMQTAARFVAD